MSRKSSLKFATSEDKLDETMHESLMALSREKQATEEYNGNGNDDASYCPVFHELCDETLQKEDSDCGSWSQKCKENLRRNYNPRQDCVSSFIRPTRATTGNETFLIRRRNAKSYDKGENPEDVKIEDDEKSKMQWGSPSKRMKNYVIDYASLRRSGYFLKEDKKENTSLDILNESFSSSKDGSWVDTWLDSLPNDSPNLKVSQEDLMGQHAFSKDSKSKPCINLSDKFTSEEDKFKRFILEGGSSVKYTRKPVPTLTYRQVDFVLEPINAKIDEYLEELHKEVYSDPHEYVCGTLDVSSFFKKDTRRVQLGTNGGSSWMDMFIKWISCLLNRGQNNLLHTSMNENLSSMKVVLEPYHGPIAVNGALIESGTMKVINSKGIMGTVVEEVKVALQAIYEALRRVSSSANLYSKSGQGNTSQQQINKKGQEDPEIARLTEILQTKQLLKKNRFRSVFGLKNPEKIPSFSLLFRRQQAQNRRRGFLRAVDGWVQRRAATNRRHRLRYRILDNLEHLNQPQQQDVRSGQNQAVPTSSAFNSILAAMRSAVPFQVQGPPVFPMSSAQGPQNESFRHHRSLNQRQENPVVIPTRYQILRDFARNNRKAKSMKSRKGRN